MGHMSPRLKARRGRFGPGGLAPIVTITSPANGASFASAGSPVSTASVNFTGTAFDDVDGDISAVITWDYNGSPFAQAGGSVTQNLPVGTHVITATAIATTGGSPLGVGTDSITITVT